MPTFNCISFERRGRLLLAIGDHKTLWFLPSSIAHMSDDIHARVTVALNDGTSFVVPDKMLANEFAAKYVFPAIDD